MMNAFVLSVTILGVAMPSGTILGVAMPSVAILSVAMLNDVMLYIAMLGVIMQGVLNSVLLCRTSGYTKMTNIKTLKC